jgi:hypothetical protein
LSALAFAVVLAATLELCGFGDVLRALGIFGSLEAAVRAAAFNVEPDGKGKLRSSLVLRAHPNERTELSTS